MGELEEQRAMLSAKFGAILPHLDERQRRLLIGAEARSLGHGGIRAVARAVGVREATVSLGVRELDSGEAPLGRVRRPGGGRKRVVDLDPALRTALLALVEPDVRGDPMSPLRWTTKSTRKLAEELTRQGHRISADTVGDLLREEGFSLQGNAKILEGKQHPDRDAQFHYLNERARDHQNGGAPVISVDTKKKELVGSFKNNGREWEPKGEPVRVDTRDFPDRELGRAVPYGIYDVAANTGWVNVGTDHDTAAFAVEFIRRWWNGAGRAAYPAADRLLINATAGQPPANNPHPLSMRSLQDPELTGMSRQQLSDLIGVLIPELALQREQTLHTIRGHARLVAPGPGAKAKLAPADRILATVLHLRKLATMNLLGQLFGVSAVTISRASQEVRPLLEAHGHHIDASTARFRTPTDLATFLASSPAQVKIKKTS
jgi:transposase